ncbi:MAG: hypothetical protein QM617_09155 [Comamonas sp.]
MADEKVKLVATRRVRHDGKDYGPGRPDGTDFEASKAQAEALIAAGVAEAAKTTATTATTAAKK